MVCLFDLFCFLVGGGKVDRQIDRYCVQKIFKARGKKKGPKDTELRQRGKA